MQILHKKQTYLTFIHGVSVKRSRRISRTYIPYIILLMSFFVSLHSMEEKLVIAPGAARAMRRLGGVISHIKPAMDKDAEQFTGEGFVTGTLVHTPQGVKPIQELVIGDEVCSFDRFNKKQTVSKVVRRRQKKFPNVIKVQVDDEVVESNGDQRFLDESMNWQYLRDIPEGLHVSSYNGDIQQIMHLTRSPEERMLHKLSLHGAHNYVVGDKKLVAHNDPVVLPAWLLWTFCGARVFNACTSIYGAYSQRANAVENPFETELQKRIAAHSMRNVTIGDLQKAAAAGHKVPKELLEEYAQLIGINTPIGSMAEKDLGLFADRFGMAEGAKNLLLMPKGPDLNEEQLKEALKIGGGAAAVVGGGAAVGTVLSGSQEGAVSSASSSAVSLGDSLKSGVKSSAINGGINASLQLGLGLWTGDVSSIGQAASTFGWTVGGQIVKDGAWTGGKVIAQKAGEKYAPTLTKRVLEWVPGIGQVVTVADGCWNIYSVGATAKGWIQRKWNPAPAEPIGLSPEQREAILKHQEEWKQSEAYKIESRLLRAGVANLKSKGKPKGKSAIPQAGDNKSRGIGGGGSGNKGPSLDPKPPRNTDYFGNMYEVFKKAAIGKALKDASEGTSFLYDGAKIFRVIKDLPQYGIKAGDWFYLDMLHKNHIEVFKSCGKVMRTVLNMDGTQNLTKLLSAGVRSIAKCIGR